jgi:hypothetical protein
MAIRPIYKAEPSAKVADHRRQDQRGNGCGDQYYN